MMLKRRNGRTLFITAKPREKDELDGAIMIQANFGSLSGNALHGLELGNRVRDQG